MAAGHSANGEGTPFIAKSLSPLELVPVAGCKCKNTKSANRFGEVVGGDVAGRKLVRKVLRGEARTCCMRAGELSGAAHLATHDWTVA